MWERLIAFFVAVRIAAFTTTRQWRDSTKTAVKMLHVCFCCTGILAPHAIHYGQARGWSAFKTGLMNSDCCISMLWRPKILSGTHDTSSRLAWPGLERKIPKPCEIYRFRFELKIAFTTSNVANWCQRSQMSASSGVHSSVQIWRQWWNF